MDPKLLGDVFPLLKRQAEEAGPFEYIAPPTPRTLQELPSGRMLYMAVQLKPQYFVSVTPTATAEILRRYEGRNAQILWSSVKLHPALLSINDGDPLDLDDTAADLVAGKPAIPPSDDLMWEVPAATLILEMTYTDESGKVSRYYKVHNTLRSMIGIVETLSKSPEIESVFYLIDRREADQLPLTQPVEVRAPDLRGFLEPIAIGPAHDPTRQYSAPGLGLLASITFPENIVYHTCDSVEALKYMRAMPTNGAQFWCVGNRIELLPREEQMLQAVKEQAGEHMMAVVVEVIQIKKEQES